MDRCYTLSVGTLVRLSAGCRDPRIYTKLFLTIFHSLKQKWAQNKRCFSLITRNNDNGRKIAGEIHTYSWYFCGLSAKCVGKSLLVWTHLHCPIRTYILIRYLFIKQYIYEKISVSFSVEWLDSCAFGRHDHLFLGSEGRKTLVRRVRMSWWQL